MGLTAKFNLALLLTFIFGLALAAGFSHWLLQQNAREEVLLNAEIMMEAASAIRGYTADEVRPLLTLQMKRSFLPQSVPAYAAMKNIDGMRETLSDYRYKEAALNPTNPADRATDWEADIIAWFRDNDDAQSLVGERDAVNGRALYYARPIRISDPSCLSCHGRPDDAPATLIERYGDDNGFGWQLDETIGAQIVSVPMSVPLARAERALGALLFGLTSIFLLVALVINLMLYFIVVRPVNRMSRIADQISRGEEPESSLAVAGRDQIASLGRSFNRMRLSLESAMKMLEETMNGSDGRI
jgi:protein-histidine pros-kinase